jgi:hypothetical protein
MADHRWKIGHAIFPFLCPERKTFRLGRARQALCYIRIFVYLVLSSLDGKVKETG